jgi:hypothetical protein
MYSVDKATKEIIGMVDVTVENNKDNAVELAAAWGLFAHKSFREGYTIKDNCVVFRMTTKTFTEWLDIIKSVKGE